jgi:hypothetical protein
LPTIGFRSFTNAFCPCCLNQKQRDCENHVEVSLMNALKALGSLRRLQGISEAMKKCKCVAHMNVDYQCCHTSLASFIAAVSCPQVEYPTLSECNGPSISIREQELANIKASDEKEKIKADKGEFNANRNTHREGPARQKKSIALVSWGGLFTCHERKCAHQTCPRCGIEAFFATANMCDAERNEHFTVKVRKYENIPGRTRGMQLEIVEVVMNGAELIAHLVRCALVALPHEWNIKWNTHMRQLCINTYEEGCLNLMTDFSAVLDHDVQDRLNTAIPRHFNQCVVLASYSPQYVTVGEVNKRIQMNDVWHCWSSQGGVIEANYYYHSVVVRHLMQHYTSLGIKRLNIFTDGCAEQYKSRRNAYFIAELAKEYSITVTHNFAPTASFKTMVDGQGDLVKSTYRSLEKNEVEGTRCPNTYDLFKLFTSSYPLTPDPAPDATRRLMTITGRMHRFLVDTSNATADMRLRADSKNDVIITDYLKDRWDAPVLKGIKTIFCLIGKDDEQEAKLYSRDHSCFCESCMLGLYGDCTHQLTTGSLRSETVMKLPFKEAPVRKAPTVGDILEKISFFNERFAAGNIQQTVVAIPVENVREDEELFKIAMLTRTAKQLRKDYIYECNINGSMNTITVAKGVWCITVRFMECTSLSNREYIIPTKTKELKIPVLNVHFPVGWQSDRDVFPIAFVLRSEITLNQTVNYYSISQTSLNAVGLDLATDE